MSPVTPLGMPSKDCQNEIHQPPIEKTSAPIEKTSETDSSKGIPATYKITSVVPSDPRQAYANQKKQNAELPKGQSNANVPMVSFGGANSGSTFQPQLPPQAMQAMGYQATLPQPTSSTNLQRSSSVSGPTSTGLPPNVRSTDVEAKKM